MADEGFTMIEKYRDISIIHFGDRLLTVACDSCGGVGLLKDDCIKTDGFNVGYHTAFVALAETLAIRAQPLMVIDNLSVSLGSYGKSILYGITTAMEEAGLDSSLSITGSSEENFTVSSTGIGVTVLGQIDTQNFKPVPVQSEYDAILFGIPCVGDEVLKYKSKILSLESIKIILGLPSVLDLVPAGSRGVLFEAKQMAKDLDMEFNENSATSDIIRQSAGPATCAVAAADPGSVELLRTLVDIPISFIGTFAKLL